MDLFTTNEISYRNFLWMDAGAMEELLSWTDYGEYLFAETSFSQSYSSPLSIQADNKMVLGHG